MFFNIYICIYKTNKKKPIIGRKGIGNKGREGTVTAPKI